MAVKKELFAKDQPDDLDAALLTPDEIAAIELEVEADVTREAKEVAKKSLKAKLTREHKRAKGLEEQQVEVTIDIAPYDTRLLIDNFPYLQGQTYIVGEKRAQVLREQMQRTWGHQAEIDGKTENFYRRTRGQRILPSGAVVNTSQLLRA